MGLAPLSKKTKTNFRRSFRLAAPETHAPTSRLWREALLRAVVRIKDGEDKSQLDQLAEKLVELGIGGNVTALKLIGDRIDGSASDVADLNPSGQWQVRWDDG